MGAQPTRSASSSCERPRDLRSTDTFCPITLACVESLLFTVNNLLDALATLSFLYHTGEKTHSPYRL